MAIKGDTKKKYMKQYNPEYYDKNREKILEYRKKRRTKDRENLKKWRNKQLDKKREEVIRSGNVYKTKTFLNPYSSRS